VEAAREIVEKLPESVEKVGVFVGWQDPRKVFFEAGLTGVQFTFQPEDERRFYTKAIGSRRFSVLDS
jgi:phosphoribosylanthranilate isomerase